MDQRFLAWVERLTSFFPFDLFSFCLLPSAFCFFNFPSFVVIVIVVGGFVAQLDVAGYV
jgi:hypothetical protein